MKVTMTILFAMLLMCISITSANAATFKPPKIPTFTYTVPDNLSKAINKHTVDWLKAHPIKL